jgi:hypothetical protein
VDGSSFPVAVVGQPLFLQYQPRAHIRGLPADTLTWVAFDRFGVRGNVSTISVNIRCLPGYRIAADDPNMCSPCPAGQYNMPDVFDQARAAHDALCISAARLSWSCRSCRGHVVIFVFMS